MGLSENDAWDRWAKYDSAMRPVLWLMLEDDGHVYPRHLTTFQERNRDNHPAIFSMVSLRGSAAERGLILAAMHGLDVVSKEEDRQRQTAYRFVYA